MSKRKTERKFSHGIIIPHAVDDVETAGLAPGPHTGGSRAALPVTAAAAPRGCRPAASWLSPGLTPCPVRVPSRSRCRPGGRSPAPPRLTPPPSPPCRRCAEGRCSPARLVPPPTRHWSSRPPPRGSLAAAPRPSPPGREGRSPRNGEGKRSPQALLSHPHAGFFLIGRGAREGGAE